MQEQAQEKASLLAPWDRGPTAHRPPLADHHRIGRAVFGRLPPIRGVRDEQRILRTDLKEMDDTLWRSRAEVWASTPPAPECGQAILNAYFTNRPILDRIETPSYSKLTGVVVQPAGSAPGHDGIPYEAFHHGVHFVACLLGQALHAARISSRALEWVLGPSLDILVWILKSKGGDTPTDMRPLQLPTCFRKLFGAALAEMVGPAIEPHMSTDQAARAGGSCGPNIRRAFRHIETDLGEEPGVGDLWQSMRGTHCTVIDDYIDQHLRECARSASGEWVYHSLAKEAAFLFADQRQAFERLAIRWFRQILKGWRFPD